MALQAVEDMTDAGEVQFEILPPVETPLKQDYDETSSFICEVCGDDLPSQRGLNIHIGRLHPDRKDLQKSATTSGSRKRKSGLDANSDFDDDKRPKNDVAIIRRAIIKDLNPLVIDAICATGVPRPAMGLQLPTGRTLEEEIKFTNTQADWIARGVVGMKATPIAVTTAKIVGPAAPYFFGLVALAIVGVHSFKLWTLRNAILEIMKNSMVNTPPEGSSSAKSNIHYV